MRKLISLKFLQVIGSAPSKPILQFKNCMGKHVEYKIAGKNGQGVLMYHRSDTFQSRDRALPCTYQGLLSTFYVH